MINFATLKLTRRPNQYLVAPVNFTLAKAHRESPVFSCSVEALVKRFKAIALAEPRTSLSQEDSSGRRFEFIARSKIFCFPDLIAVEFIAISPEKSTLAIYARARYGYRDFGVNKARIDRWLGALAA